jgi:hypothetical protein
MDGSRHRHVSPHRHDVRAGDVVLAEDGMLGHVDEVIRSETSTPVYLVVSVPRTIGRRYPVVPWSLVAGVDGARRRIQLCGGRRALRRLPETLPLVY